jgi:hypothetical protein
MLPQILLPGLVETIPDRIGRQWILIEEPIPGQGHAAQHRIIKRQLRAVRISVIRLDQPHTPAEHCQRDRSAGLIISRDLRQIVIEGECLSQIGRTNAAGNMHPFMHNIIK